MTKEKLEALCKYLNDATATQPLPSGNRLYDVIVRLASHLRDPNGYAWELYRDGIEKPMGPTICFKENEISMVQDVGRHANVRVTFLTSTFNDENLLEVMKFLFLSNRLDVAANLLAGGVL